MSEIYLYLVARLVCFCPFDLKEANYCIMEIASWSRWAIEKHPFCSIFGVTTLSSKQSQTAVASQSSIRITRSHNTLTPIWICCCTNCLLHVTTCTWIFHKRHVFCSVYGTSPFFVALLSFCLLYLNDMTLPPQLILVSMCMTFKLSESGL